MTNKATYPGVLLCCLFVFVCLQICSTAEKKAIDKMIDTGAQLAGTMEYNVVLSEYLSHVMFKLKHLKLINHNHNKCHNKVTFTPCVKKKQQLFISIIVCYLARMSKYYYYLLLEIL